MQSYDVAVIGAGIGGLVSAALLAKEGKHVLVLEQQRDVGGCAATFSHRGFRFDSGATIGSGFQANGPMQWLAEELDIRWPLQPLDIAWEYRDGAQAVLLEESRQSLLQRFPRSVAFWHEQAAVADVLWGVAEKILLRYQKGRLQQAAALFRLLPQTLLTKNILRLSRLTVNKWLKRHNLDTDPDFIRFLDAQLLISSQTTSSFCNALYAAMALDLPRKYPCTVVGGMGTLAQTLARKVTSAGGEVQRNEKALSFVSQNNRVCEVITNRGSYRARQFLVNGSSAELASLLDTPLPASWLRTNRTHWGAFILHMGASETITRHMRSSHLQLVNRTGTLAEGDSLFLSASHHHDRSRAAEGKVAISVSTHTAVGPWWDARKKGSGHYRDMKQRYSDKMYGLLQQHIPSFSTCVDFCMAGTPVTYNRFTGRYKGLVGGYSQNTILPPKQFQFGIPNCRLVGDFTFPGQPIAAVTVGAVLAADWIGRRLRK